MKEANTSLNFSLLTKIFYVLAFMPHLCPEFRLSLNLVFEFTISYMLSPEGFFHLLSLFFVFELRITL